MIDLLKKDRRKGSRTGSDSWAYDAYILSCNYIKQIQMIPFLQEHQWNKFRVTKLLPGISIRKKNV